MIAGEIAVRTGLSQTSAHEVLRDFNAHWEINGLLIGGLAELRPRWKVGLLANAGDAALFAIEERLGVELADDVVVSSHVGLAKPDVEIYRLAASRLRVDPRRCVFIDDRQDNVDGAVEAGMTAIRHVSTERTLGELVALRSS